MGDESHASVSRAFEVGSRLTEKYPGCVSFRYWVGVAQQIDGDILYEGWPLAVERECDRQMSPQGNTIVSGAV